MDQVRSSRSHLRLHRLLAPDQRHLALAQSADSSTSSHRHGHVRHVGQHWRCDWIANDAKERCAAVQARVPSVYRTGGIWDACVDLPTPAI